MGTHQEKTRMTVIPIIIEQHAEDASFNWLLRDAAVSEPHYSLDDLTKLDNRVLTVYVSQEMKDGKYVKTLFPGRSQVRFLLQQY
jgi:hypothetical protein